MVLDWDMAKRQGFNQAIAALEQPTPEMRKAVALAIEQTRSTIERDIKDKNQQQCAAHALADAALAAAAKHLKEPTQ